MTDSAANYIDTSFSKNAQEGAKHHRVIRKACLVSIISSNIFPYQVGLFRELNACHLCRTTFQPQACLVYFEIETFFYSLFRFFILTFRNFFI